MSFFTHIFEGFYLDFKLLFNVLFLGIISWKGTSRFNGNGSDGRASFLGRGGASLWGIDFDPEGGSKNIVMGDTHLKLRNQKTRKRRYFF